MGPGRGGLPLHDYDDNWILFVKLENGRWPNPNAQDKRGALSISPSTVCCDDYWILMCDSNRNLFHTGNRETGGKWTCTTKKNQVN
jgi:hypothetical protein